MALGIVITDIIDRGPTFGDMRLLRIVYSASHHASEWSFKNFVNIEGIGGGYSGVTWISSPNFFISLRADCDTYFRFQIQGNMAFEPPEQSNICGYTTKSYGEPADPPDPGEYDVAGVIAGVGGMTGSIVWNPDKATTPIPNDNKTWISKRLKRLEWNHS